MKTLNKTIFLFLFVGISSTGCLISVNAQEPAFTASAPAEVTLGIGFNYTITGNQNVNASSIQIPDVDGIRFLSGPSTFISTQSSVINGRRENVTQVTFTYVLIPGKEGKLTIPPAVIKSGNKSYNTNQVEINVIKSSATPAPEPDSQGPVPSPQTGTSENYYIRLIPSKRTVWLGEEMVISAKIFTNENLRFSEIKYPEFEGFWKQELEPDQQAGRETVDGNQYLTQVFKRDLLIPQKTGTLRINPVDVTVLVQQRVRSQRRNPFGDIFNDPFFNDPFFDSYQNVPAKIISNPVSIEVRPLPGNAPAGFNGAVGQYTIELLTGKETARVNEALSFKLSVKGRGNLGLLKAPKIDFPPDIEVFEPKANKNITHSLNGTSGSVTFEYVVIPRYPGTFRIAPLDYSYFDPARGSYQTVRSREIVVTVDKSANTDQAEIIGMQQGIPGVLKEQVASLNTDILFIKTHIPAFHPVGKALSDSLLFRFAFPLGLILFMLLYLLRREQIKRNSDIAYARIRKARKIAVTRLNRAKKLLLQKDQGMYEEILKALWGYLGDKLSVNQAQLSRNSARTGLIARNVPDDITQELLDLIDECEMARYATGIPVDADSVYKRSEDILYKVESLIN